MKSSSQLDSEQVEPFRTAILAWYSKNKRDLPWRKTRDPYHIWVSEIMLQQTRVAAVIAHYLEFLRRFPSVQKLAPARESSVLAAWSRLGYYRRARNLHAAAKAVLREHGGAFPPNSGSWRKLPGIGRYTAAAIASIAFNEPVAVLDGNVKRVLQRLLGGSHSEQSLWTTTQQLLEPKHPGDFNQAMMELGATICLPRQPECRACPISKFCRTRGRGKLKLPEARQRKREVTHSLATRASSVRLVRRPRSAGLMPGMWELPQLKFRGKRKLLFSLRHSITVTDFKVSVVEPVKTPKAGTWVAISRLGTLPLTGLARKILRTANIIQSPG
jgi:A/G-specific adenine glycosylase